MRSSPGRHRGELVEDRLDQHREHERHEHHQRAPRPRPPRPTTSAGARRASPTSSEQHQRGQHRADRRRPGDVARATRPSSGWTARTGAARSRTRRPTAASAAGRSGSTTVPSSTCQPQPPPNGAATGRTSRAPSGVSPSTSGDDQPEQPASQRRRPQRRRERLGAGDLRGGEAGRRVHRRAAAGRLGQRRPTAYATAMTTTTAIPRTTAADQGGASADPHPPAHRATERAVAQPRERIGSGPRRSPTTRAGDPVGVPARPRPPRSRRGCGGSQPAMRRACVNPLIESKPPP